MFRTGPLGTLWATGATWRTARATAGCRIGPLEQSTTLYPNLVNQGRVIGHLTSRPWGRCGVLEAPGPGSNTRTDGEADGEDSPLLYTPGSTRDRSEKPKFCSEFHTLVTYSQKSQSFVQNLLHLLLTVRKVNVLFRIYYICISNI